ncbi:sensor histidine kinase [Streptomyces liangshanensis]|uniref:histidine kinase n=1 Tax=Streptomyces liangshanensis TaxID=2717324 RepID=A0A6G9H5W6_9ACTN|nr:ATP-binding protein [Streptomyces liangshanensis]QIQ05923.1 sensor histidine kinase [Streptomyces liangshanensis]
MSVPVAPSPHRIRPARSLSLAVPLAALVVVAAAAAAAALAAPVPARAWVAATAAGAWVCVAVTVAAAVVLVRQGRRGAVTADGEVRTAQTQLAQFGGESAHLLNVSLPSVVKRLRDGASAEAAIAATAPPSDPQLRRLLEVFAAEVAASERRAAESRADCATAVERLARGADDLDRLMTTTLPAALGGLRSGGSADTVLGTVEPPTDPRLRVLVDVIVREFATSERRGAAAQAASAKALSRVQAKAVSMLADLREMQDKYGEEVFGDLLKLDHNTSQLGLLTDRLALLMGGRASRSWNKPIPMESVLRGAVGRISAYQRVRLHCSSDAAIAGFAAEGVMHLLAELMDNAANFSPPIDEVHVYVEERTAGIVVTIEDSGLKMADAAMRRAEESVSGRMNDLATLQGTRLGLAVVGRLAAKYHLSVNYRPSSRGGTGVVVLFPPQLLAQQRAVLPEQSVRPTRDTFPERDPLPEQASFPEQAGFPERAVGAEPAVRNGHGVRTGQAAFPEHPVRPPDPTARPADADTPPPAAPPLPAPAAPGDGPRVATPNGLPVRPPGRTMAAADRGRPEPEPETGAPRTGRDAGSQFGAFHRARHAHRPPEGTP